MSSCDDDDDTSDSLEEIDAVKSIRPPPRPSRQAVPVAKQAQNNKNAARSLSPPTSVLSLSGDKSSLQLCLNNYTSGNKSEQLPSVIPLNVGGVKYMTRLSTLKRYPDSMLAALFSGRYRVDKDADGNYFLDSNGVLFGHLLEYLRNGLIPPKEHAVALYREASYYGLHELVDKLQYMPPVVTLMVKEAHISQFPNFQEAKEDVLKAAMENATFTKIGEVLVHAFRSEFVPKVSTFNPNHGCVVEGAHVKVGPWDTPVDEEVFIRCLENDLIEDGFNLKPHEMKRKCKYYHGQSCQKFVYRLQIMF